VANGFWHCGTLCPGIEKRKKVGDRTALIDQLWSAIEAGTAIRREAAV
jgi:hypothetical protein